MRELLFVFGKLGLLGFGGPIATLAMMEEEACRRRRWLTQEEYARIYAILKCMPGPTATQMAVFLGRLRGGFAGGAFAGALFVLPAFLLVLSFSYVYLKTGVVGRSEALFAGMQAGALAVILISTIQLARPYRHDRRAWLIGSISAALILLHPRWEPLVILSFGIFGALGAGGAPERPLAHLLFPVALGKLGSLPILESKLFQLFWVCFKSGAFVFGTGLAIIPLLEADVVGHYHWLNHAQFMDGLAIGQVTPGPVVITATFIGYQVAGLPGALLGTFAIFLPPFFNVLVILPRILKRIEGKAWMQGFAAYAIPSVVGGIIGTSVKLGVITLVSPLLIVAFVMGSVGVFWLKLPAWATIPLCGGIAALGHLFLS